ncbi:MAG: hypothetical protein HYZ26_00725 [Chloroflexi bacterium]|nr:hypothetical protein [Chloroflexota bacterium]
MPILDENGNYTGGLGLPGIDQTTDEGAVLAMATRIGLVVETINEFCNSCGPEDYLIAAALAQNGSGFTPDTVIGLLKDDGLKWGSYFSQPMDTHGDWNVDRQEQAGLNFGKQLMLLLYLNDLRELYALGWELPWGLDLEDLDEIEAMYITPYYDPPGE